MSNDQQAHSEFDTHCCFYIQKFLIGKKDSFCSSRHSLCGVCEKKGVKAIPALQTLFVLLPRCILENKVQSHSAKRVKPESLPCLLTKAAQVRAVFAGTGFFTIPLTL